jgi:hypothetical protein
MMEVMYALVLIVLLRLRWVCSHACCSCGIKVSLNESNTTQRWRLCCWYAIGSRHQRCLVLEVMDDTFFEAALGSAETYVLVTCMLLGGIYCR